LKLEPYLHFNGNCEEALTFYAGVFGGEIAGLNRFAGSPLEGGLPPDYLQKVMHASFKSPSIAFMASDGMPSSEEDEVRRVSMCLSTTDLAEAERVFAKLGSGGEVTMPLQDTFWGSKFGMLTDKFGVHWMMNCETSTN
jgi:PhnB protein